jgi:hypothetical protein
MNNEFSEKENLGVRTQDYLKSDIIILNIEDLKHDLYSTEIDLKNLQSLNDRSSDKDIAILKGRVQLLEEIIKMKEQDSENGLG